MKTGIESLFPLALGVMLILLFAGALFTATLPMVVLLAGMLFFAAGLFFGRPGVYQTMRAGVSIVAPFTILSVFLIAKFGAAFLILPLMSAGGVAAGFAVRRRLPGRAPGFLLGALWIVIVIFVALYIAPGRMRLPGIGPQT